MRVLRACQLCWELDLRVRDVEDSEEKQTGEPAKARQASWKDGSQR